MTEWSLQSRSCREKAKPLVIEEIPTADCTAGTRARVSGSSSPSRQELLLVPANPAGVWLGWGESWKI